MDNLYDAIENITFLYMMSKDVDYNNHPIKKVPMIKSDGITMTGEFFRRISNNDKKVFSALKRYIYSMKEVPWVEGGMFLNENNDVRILVPTQNNVFSTSILVHECTHALDTEGIIDLDYDNSFAEVLPFLNQFLFIDMLKEYYHDIEELQKSHMDFMIHNQLLYNADKYVNCADEENVDYEGIQRHFKYLLGSLYSIVLYEWYKNDSDFMKTYSRIYDGRGTLRSLLDYYEVKLEDIDNIKLVKSLMKK